jgi:predicted metal-dependent phosphoesterase TrpH
MINRRKNFIKHDSDFVCDFHIHSQYSFDSILPIKKIITISKRKRLDCIAITDHNSLKGATEAKKNADDNLMIIVGSEIRTEHGDIIGLFLNEEVSSKIYFEVIDEIKSQGGLVVAPHPYKSQIKNYLKYVDIIEVMNARISEKLNHQAIDYSEQHSIPGIGSSDAHIGYEIGKIRTVFSRPICSEEDLRQAMLQHNCEILGECSPRWVHYISASIGALKTGNIKNLLHSTVKKNLGGIRRG